MKNPIILFRIGSLQELRNADENFFKTRNKNVINISHKLGHEIWSIFKFHVFIVNY